MQQHEIDQLAAAQRDDAPSARGAMILVFWTIASMIVILIGAAVIVGPLLIAQLP